MRPGSEPIVSTVLKGVLNNNILVSLLHGKVTSSDIYGFGSKKTIPFLYLAKPCSDFCNEIGFKEFSLFGDDETIANKFVNIDNRWYRAK
jgi:hypothetical protein